MSAKYYQGDVVCWEGDDWEYPYVVANSPMKNGLYDLIDEDSIVRHNVKRAEMMPYFQVGDVVMNIDDGREGIVYNVEPGRREVQVVFGTASRKQEQKPGRYNKTVDGQFITRVNRKQLKRIGEYDILNVKNFNESMFLEMIGGF